MIEELRQKEKELADLKLKQSKETARHEREKKLLENSQELDFDISEDGLDEMASSLNNSGVLCDSINISDKVISRLRSSVASIIDNPDPE